MRIFRKIIKIIASVIGILIIINLAFFTCFSIYTKSNILSNIKIYDNFNQIEFFSKTEFNEIKSDDKLPSVIILGCGAAKGEGLNPNNNIEVKLNKITNRTIYNRAIGGSIQYAILQVQSGLVEDIIKKKYYGSFYTASSCRQYKITCIPRTAYWFILYI